MHRPSGSSSDRGAELTQLARQIADPICLFVADVCDAGDHRGSSGEQRDGGQRLYGVADVVHVDADPVQRLANDRDLVRVPLNVAAHLFQAVTERHVPLQRLWAQPGHGDASARDGRGGPEVTGGGSVRLDPVLAALVTAWVRRR